MASLALHLKSHPHKPSHNLLKSITFSHHFSSSSNNNNNNNSNSKTDGFSSYFSDIKSKLKQRHQQQQQHRQHQQQQSPFQSSPQPSPSTDVGADVPVKPYPFSTSLTDIKSKLKQHEQQQQQQQQQQRSSGFLTSVFDSLGSSTTPSQSNSTDEIRRNLSEFRRRSSSTGGEIRTEGVTFQAIRESLKELRTATGDKGTNKMSFNNMTSFRPRPSMPVRDRGGVIGGSSLPLGVFGKELKEEAAKKDGGVEEEEEVWMRLYTMDELGKKLRELRPEVKGKEGGEGICFSLSELNERLKKVKEIDEKELAAKSGSAFADLRKSIQMIDVDPKKSSNMVPIHRIDILGPGPPSYMLSPPKEHLVEKYFHPDNMSAEEKLKLELKKVREEFKMHESDCGSARVQVAQLTTEILHLSSVLHKKDKHSRRGLQAKVQQRKKLLKYLRRTDWESYCFVLSKLGLRDNPDYKN